MIGILISIFITCLLLGLLWWFIMTVWPSISGWIAEPFRTWAYAVLVVIMVLVVIKYVLLPLLAGAGVHVPYL